MIERLATHLLLQPKDVRPSHPDWEVIGVFNPGVARCGDETVILARVAERPREQREGWTPHPRWSREDGYVVDWVPNEHLEPKDPRVMRHRHTGLVRLTFISHLRVARSRDGRTIETVDAPMILPANEMEEFGLEDPRIIWLDGRYYITYVAVSRHGPATALASTTDFKTFERHGIIFCPENKDVVLLPDRVGGEYIALHRPLGEIPFCRPEMWVARSPDLVHWGAHAFLFAGAGDWEGGRVGAGAPPLAVPDGWLEIYHGNRRPEFVGEVGMYCAGAMLLAKDEPGRVLAVSREPVFEPQLEFEKDGFVDRVVFPTGVLEEDDRLLIYYGASDKYCAMVEVARDDVLRS
ncbi:MAG TPA: glycoside hydrolase family 130 protein, partial [Lacipirellulaceae bacterium]|nr:glycoside hydrolase family 130 protein [Lacipirellulaceae bacterium]